MVEAPKRATKFAANEQYTILFRSLLGADINKQGLAIMTGVSAGITEVQTLILDNHARTRRRRGRNVAHHDPLLFFPFMIGLPRCPIRAG